MLLLLHGLARVRSLSFARSAFPTPSSLFISLSPLLCASPSHSVKPCYFASIRQRPSTFRTPQTNFVFHLSHSLMVSIVFVRPRLFMVLSIFSLAFQLIVVPLFALFEHSPQLVTSSLLFLVN